MKTAAATLVALLAASGAASAAVINLAVTPSQSDPTKSVAVTETLAAGTYSVTEPGIAGGGMYDAYSVYAPDPGNSAFADDWWYDIGGVDHQTTTGGARYNTAAQALSAYQGLGASIFTLATTSTVSFFLEDTVYPFFGDDSGGVSLQVSPLAAVPEPASLAILGAGLFGLALLMRRRCAV